MWVRTQSPKLWMMLIVLGFGVLCCSVAAAAQTTTVYVLEESRSAYSEWQHQTKETFEATHPNIKVELVGRGGDSKQMMQNYLAAGVPLDIGWYDPWLIVLWAKEGLIENLDPYVERDKAQFADWFPRSFDMYRLGGNLYGLPRDLQLPGIFYNAEWYAEAGLARPSANWTFNDLADNARRLTRPDQEEITRWGFKLPTWRNWLNVIWNFGGDYIDHWVEPTEFTGDSPEVVAALDFLYNLGQTNGMPGTDALHRATGSIGSAFVGRRVAMGLTNTFSLTSIHNSADFEWDVAPIPSNSGTPITSINALGWFMFSSSQNKDAAWAYLKHITSRDALEKMIEIVGTPPPSRSVIVESWLPTMPAPANRGMFFDYVDAARPLGTLQDEVYAGFSGPSHDVIWGDMPLRAAIETMAQETTAAIELWNQQ